MSINCGKKNIHKIMEKYVVKFVAVFFLLFMVCFFLRYAELFSLYGLHSIVYEYICTFKKCEYAQSGEFGGSGTMASLNNCDLL